MNESEQASEARNLKIAHIVNKQAFERSKAIHENREALTATQRRQMHILAFEGLTEQCAMITRTRIGEVMIAELQDVLGRFHTQVQDTTASGFKDIPTEYTGQLKWFDSIAEKAIEARELYKEALGAETRTERKMIAKRIREISKHFERLMQLVHQSGNGECAERIRSQLGWFRSLTLAAWKGEAMPQPA